MVEPGNRVTRVTREWFSGLANSQLSHLSIWWRHGRERGCAGTGSELKRLSRSRLYEQVAEQIMGWVQENGLKAGDKLRPERELAVSLGVSRATVRQALVALEVIGVVAVRHGDGAVLADASGSAKVLDAIRAHARRIPDVIDARDALETKIAALAAARRTGDDLARIDDALEVMAQDIEKVGAGSTVTSCSTPRSRRRRTPPCSPA